MSIANNKIIPKAPKAYYDIPGAAEHFSISRTMIFDWIRTGKINKYYPNGVSANPKAKKKKTLIKTDEVEAHIKSTRVETINIEEV